MGIDQNNSETYFFDTYAFVEVLNGNKNYEQYGKNINAITTKMNLLELHYLALKEKGERIADAYFEFFRGMAVEISDDTIKKASLFRNSNRKKKFSYIDCIGYVMARSRGIKFLTGDNAFKGMEGVEFVK
ncbi:PIN domain-containing protein [Candidatus Woesearchaeota archaeon]|nr:PIN domain-containing protein [Candidatus Woesearchaeota archaeon]